MLDAVRNRMRAKILADETGRLKALVGALRGLVRRLGEPAIRAAVSRAMQEMGGQFVLGETMTEALRRGRGMMAKGSTYSFDMLGEEARTEKDALRYHRA